MTALSGAFVSRVPEYSLVYECLDLSRALIRHVGLAQLSPSPSVLRHNLPQYNSKAVNVNLQQDAESLCLCPGLWLYLRHENKLLPHFVHEQCCTPVKLHHK